MDPQKIDTSPHAFIGQALAGHRTRLREAFAQDSQAALSDMKTSLQRESGCSEGEI